MGIRWNAVSGSLLLMSAMLAGGSVTATPAIAVPSLCSTAIVEGPIDNDAAFNRAVEKVNAGACNVIDIKTGFIFETAPSSLVPDESIVSLTISGPASGAMILDGNGLSGIRINNFFSPNLHLEVSDLVFRNFNGEDDGATGQAALDVHGVRAAHFSNVAFIDNVGIFAGGLHVQGDSTVTVEVTMTGNIEFTRNRATVPDFSGPGALSVTNSNADGTSSLTIGADEGAHTITFQDNTSAARSGGIGAQNVEMWGGTFTGNTSSAPGGAISATGSVTLRGVTFTDNSTSGAEGGAVFSESNVTVLGGTFTYNDATRTNAAGGAISAWGSVTVDASTTFTSNEAAGNGGAISALGPVTVTASTFRGNRAVNGGGIYAGDSSRPGSGTVTVTNSTFEDATVTGSGGAIRALTSIDSTGSQFTRIHAAEYGGAIYAPNATSTDSTFTSNTAGAYDGGAIYVERSVVSTRSRFTTNRAERNGGAIQAKSVTDTGSRFIGNEARDTGGAVDIRASLGPPIRGLSSTFTGSTFEDSSATLGGAISFQNGSLNLEGLACSFTRNSSASLGGAIYVLGNGVDPSSVSISNCNFARNMTDGIGGALFIGGETPAEIRSSGFVNNEAKGLLTDTEGIGGAVAAEGALTIGTSEFRGNTAAGDGGAVRAARTLTLEDSTVTNNTSSGGSGGAVFVFGPTATISGGVFTGNKSFKDGGAVYVSGSVEITDSAFSGNEAISRDATATPRDGGAVAAAEDASVTDSTFTRNSATQGGGAVSSYGSVSVTGSIFDRNTSGPNGGALNVSRTATVVGSTFKNNTSVSFGGALNAQDLSIRSSSFLENGSGFGGAISVNRSADITNSTFVGNVAGYGGALSFGTSATPSRIAYSTLVGNTNRGLEATAINAPIATPIALTGSVLAGSAPLCRDEGGPPSTLNLSGRSSYSFATDTSCSGGPTAPQDIESIDTRHTTAARLGFITPLTTDDTPGMQVLIPRAPAVINEYVPLSTLRSVTTDQLGGLRNSPNGFTSAGAVQVRTTSVSSPANTTVTPGSNATFSVTGYPSVGPTMTYQWQSSTDATTWSDITGNASAQTATLTLPSVAQTDSGLLVRVVVAVPPPGGGGATSTSARLTVRAGTPEPGPGPAPTPGPSSPSTQDPVRSPSPTSIPGPLRPGGAYLEVDGRIVPVDVERLPGRGGLRVRGQGWDVVLDGLNRNGRPLGLNDQGALVIDVGSGVRMGGAGFAPGSMIGFFLDPPIGQARSATYLPRASAPTTADLGDVPVGADGRFSAIVDVPNNITPGSHVLQAVGIGTSGELRVISLGVVVDAWIEMQRGKRTSLSRFDKVRATGTTGGLPAGATLTLWVRSPGEDAFRRSDERISVRADGSFRWVRKIPKSQRFAAYVSYAKTDSNRVRWARLR